MAHISHTVYFVWAILAVMLLYSISGLLIDSSVSGKWNQGHCSGAFKRVMTDSYLFVIVFTTGFAIIKCNYGYTVSPNHGVQPTPYQEWSRSAQNAIFPLYLASAIGWGLEMVTHLEELCFWLFLVHSTSARQDWFKSLYFKTWTVGSCIAVLVMPLITIFTRENVLQCEAYTFLTGGLASLSMTIWFIPVLWTFPSFIANLKGKDVETATLVRLTKFHELNCIRVVFRFLFTVPLVILGVDGVRPHQHITGKMLPTDLLGILAAIGCIVSSGITLVIFFPRSIEGEMTHKEKQRTRRRQRAEQSLARWNRTHAHMLTDAAQSYFSITQQSKTELDLSVTGSGVLPVYEVVPPIKGMTLEDDIDIKAASMSMGYMGGSLSLQPNRRTMAGEVALGAVLTSSEVELAETRSKQDRTVSNLVHHWRSPIDIARPVVSRLALAGDSVIMVRILIKTETGTGTVVD